VAAAVIVGIAVAWMGVLGLGGKLYAIRDPARSAFAALVERIIARESKSDAPVSATQPEPSGM
jgi:hypothetical protein